MSSTTRDRRLSDNGASGEGGPNGSVNENNFFNSVPDDIADNLKYLDVLGSAETYNHYPTGWAMAFNTPFKMFKRHTWEGGVCDPMIVHWPKGIKAKGEIRDQYTHCSDIVPTVYECLESSRPTWSRATRSGDSKARASSTASTTPTRRRRRRASST